jgi:sugar O-acyltransferase (sialic acid O-acetyltransferase NeuD family)
MNDLVIYGAGAVAQQAVQIVEALNRLSPTWNLLGMLDDAVETHGTVQHGSLILGGAEWLRGRSDIFVCIAIGSSSARWHVAQRLDTLPDIRYATLVHPTALVASRCLLGQGIIIYPGVIMDTDITIGEHVILNKHCTIGHDTVIESFATLSPGVNIGGMVKIGVGCELGINSATIYGITIGDWSIIGAGGVVIRHLPDNITGVGVPARVIEQRLPGWHKEI